MLSGKWSSSVYRAAWQNALQLSVEIACLMLMHVACKVVITVVNCHSKILVFVIVSGCPQTRLYGGLMLLRSVDNVAVPWLKTCGSCMHARTLLDYM